MSIWISTKGLAHGARNKSKQLKEDILKDLILLSLFDVPIVMKLAIGR